MLRPQSSEPGRRQRLEEEAEMARLMAILSKEIAYRSGCEQALESRISRLSGLIQEDQRLNRKEDSPRGPTVGS